MSFVQDHGIVAAHYGETSLLQRVEEALERHGLPTTGVNWAVFSPLDQFHVRGVAATSELANALGIPRGSKVLDVGSGLGGPARLLAATYGCEVTGIDLNAPYVEVATMLTKRVGLADLVTFHQANALALPFPDATFDFVWSQHVAMNIADRNGLYREMHRVLKPNGRVGIYDAVAGDGRPPHFPVPWARTPDLSFLVTPREMRDAMGRAGFSEVSWTDQTAPGVAWFEAQRSMPGEDAPVLSLKTVMGSEFSTMAQNFGRSLAEGRVGLVQTVHQRDGG